MNSRKTKNIGLDCDGTLTKGYMPNYLLQSRHIDQQKFWNKVKEMGETLGIKDAMFAMMLIQELNSGQLQGMKKGNLRLIGKQIPANPNVEGCLNQLADYVQIDIISCGLSEMIEGMSFVEAVARTGGGIYATSVMNGIVPIRYIMEAKSIVISSTKPKIMEKIAANCGGLENSLFVGDSQGDMPAIDTVRAGGGQGVLVFDGAKREGFCREMYEGGRVDFYGPADYRPGSGVREYLVEWAKK